MSCSRNLLPAFGAALIFAASQGAASAQYYYYPAPAPSYGQDYGYPDDADAPPPRTRLYGGAPYGRARGEDEDYNPRARPKARASRPARPGFAALPSDADPAYSTPIDLDGEIDMSQTTREVVPDPTGEAPGTLTVNTRERKLYLSLAGGRALEYGIGVGRQGFAWHGRAYVGRKAWWPGWTPPKDMLRRRPDLPAHMDGGIENPLGARALYLFQSGKDTLFRIHGTNEPDTIGHAVSSGCIRMLNADVIDLYQRVPKGARVVVL